MLMAAPWWDDPTGPKKKPKLSDPDILVFFEHLIEPEKNYPRRVDLTAAIREYQRATNSLIGSPGSILFRLKKLGKIDIVGEELKYHKSTRPTRARQAPHRNAINASNSAVDASHGITNQCSPLLI